jgi:hypothetical protein
MSSPVLKTLIVASAGAILGALNAIASGLETSKVIEVALTGAVTALGALYVQPPQRK